MATCSNLLLEDELQCSICLDVFTDPVTTPCGHNFCMICINKYLSTSSQYKCPVCKKELPHNFDPCVNTLLSGLAVEFRKSFQVNPSSTAEKSSSSQSETILCDTCTKVKMEAVKSCLDCGVSYCETHLMPHRTAAKLKKHKLMDPVENLEDYICQIHEKPLEMFCRDDQTSVCQFCMESDHKNHNVVPAKEETNKRKNQLNEAIAEVQQMIQDRLQMIDELKHSVELNKINTEKEKSDSMKIFRSLISCIERNQTQMMKVMEEKQKSAEHQAEEFIKDLEQEITELKRRSTELEKISNTEDHLHLLQTFSLPSSTSSTKNWTDVELESRVSVETLRELLSQLQDSLSKEIQKLPELEMMIVQKYTVNVILDPDTAHPNLIVSDNGKQVRHKDKRQNVSESWTRFKRCVYVLGKQGFSSGRFYYEVQVTEKTDWHVGVAKESINRKKDITINPKNGLWIMWLKNKTEYKAGEAPPVLLTLNPAPQKVGVFVDYEEGLVSFYDTEARSCIHSFTGQSFTEKLYPIFSPCLNQGGKNSAPMIITAV